MEEEDQHENDGGPMVVVLENIDSIETLVTNLRGEGNEGKKVTKVFHALISNPIGHTLTVSRLVS